MATSSDYTHWLIVDGVINGSWKKTKDDTIIDVTTFERLSKRSNRK